MSRTTWVRVMAVVALALTGIMGARAEAGRANDGTPGATARAPSGEPARPDQTGDARRAPRPTAYVLGQLDGPLGRHLGELWRLEQWKGETDAPLLLPAKRVHRLTPQRREQLLALHAAGQPIVLTSAEQEHIARLHEILGQAAAVTLRPPFERLDFYAHAKSRFGPKTFTMMPPTPAPGQPSAGAETDEAQRARAEALLTWIEQDVEQSVRTGGQPSGALATGQEILEVDTGVKAWEVKAQYPIVYYWGACGFETSCTNTYQVYYDTWPVYVSEPEPGSAYTDFFVTQLSANLSASGCWDVYRKHGGLDSPDHVSAFWARQYALSARVPKDPALCSADPSSACSCATVATAGCYWDSADLNVDPSNYLPQNVSQSSAYTDSQTYSLGVTGTAGVGATAVGFSAGAQFGTSLSFTYKALNTTADVGGADPSLASWTYDAWQFVSDNLQDGDTFKDLSAAPLEADLITDGTFSPTTTYVWQASQNVRDAYQGATLPVTFDLSALLGWAYWPATSSLNLPVTQCTGGGASETSYDIGANVNGYRVNAEPTSGLVFDANSHTYFYTYGTVPLGPASASQQDVADGNPGAPYLLSLTVNVPFAPTVAPPTVLSVSPTSGQQGQLLGDVSHGVFGAGVTITGDGFQPGAQCGFGPGITVLGGCTYVGPTTLDAALLIDRAATQGPRMVTVLNPDGLTATLPGGFSVAAGSPPHLTALTPSSGSQGATVVVELDGTQFEIGAVCDFGEGILVTSCAYNSTTKLVATIQICPVPLICTAASPGPRTVVVQNPGKLVGVLYNAFTVTAAP